MSEYQLSDRDRAAMTPEEREAELAERKRKEDEFWESCKLREDNPRFDEIMAPWVACNIACALVSETFRKYGKLPRAQRKRIEHKVYTVLRKSGEANKLRKLRVRISFHKNDVCEGLEGSANNLLGEYTAVLQAWAADDHRNYLLRAGLPSPTYSKNVLGPKA